MLLFWDTVYYLLNGNIRLAHIFDAIPAALLYVQLQWYKVLQDAGADVQAAENGEKS